MVHKPLILIILMLGPVIRMAVLQVGEVGLPYRRGLKLLLTKMDSSNNRRMLMPVLQLAGMYPFHILVSHRNVTQSAK